MLKIALAVLMMIHGLIHFLGFFKAFHLAEVSQLTQPISRATGLLWMLAAIIFLMSALLLLLKLESWWFAALAAILLSQFLITRDWTDAKFGSIANVIVLVPVIVSMMNALPSSYQNRFKTEVQMRLHTVADVPVLAERELQHLPVPVQKYLHYVGAVGRPPVRNFRAVFRGSMKTAMDGEWKDIESRQYNFFDVPARLFYIESSMFGIPFDGLHMYVGNSATMQIKVASLVQVVDAKGEKMNQSETVTLFNDMCVLAPASLIDKTIQWELIDSLTVRARFTNRENTIAAILSFNDAGGLTNFVSNDRFQSADGKVYASYPWSTPVKDYRDFGGWRIASRGEAIWHTPGGQFPYARFDLVELDYNCSEFR